MVGVPLGLIYRTRESYTITWSEFLLLIFFFVIDYIPTYPEFSLFIRLSYHRGFSTSGVPNCTT
jgi:hypothetical protein